MLTELFFLFLLIIINGLFAMSEAAMISARRVRLQQRAEEGDRGAAAALAVSKQPTRFLSTTQIGITLVGILSGAIGGSTLAQRLHPLISSLPLLAPYSETISIGIVVLSITYLSLVIGELVPKRLALNNAERIAAAIARPMQLLSRLTAPLVSVLTFSTRLVLMFLRIRPSSEPSVTEDEVKIMLEEGAKAGAFQVAERVMAENVFRLDDWPITAVMTPHTAIAWLNLSDKIEQIISTITQDSHATYPVYETDIRNVVGVVSLKKLWQQIAEGQTLDLSKALQAPVYVPETASALQTMEVFRQPGRHMALVIDEHGSVIGLVTVLDIIEAVIGDLPDTASPQAVQRADGSWLIDGTYNISMLEDLLETSLFPEEERYNYQTVSGFMMFHIGRIPVAADQFEWRGFRFEVVDMDGRRIDKVLATRIPASENS